jgi:arylsulfatase A-like enzyme
MTPARQRGTEFKSEFDWGGRLTLPHALRRADPSYRAAHFGKFGSDMGADPEEVGFDESDDWTSNRTGGMPTTMEERSRTLVKDDPKLVSTITDRAVGFIERQIGSHPFYVQISHYATHLQVQTRQESLERFESKGAPDRAVTPAFAGMLYDLDESIGQLLDALDRLGINDSTYVIFMADNGGRGTIPDASDALSAPNRPLNGAKHTLYEGGIRVPFLVAGPGVEPNSVSDVPVTGYDLLPTLYDLAGGRESLPPEVDGGSFREVLGNPAAGWVERGFDGLVFHRPRHPRGAPSSAIRVGDYKLLVKYASPRQASARELFDLSRDLGERNDLSAKMPEKAAELEQMLLGYLQAAGAETPVQ